MLRFLLVSVAVVTVHANVEFEIVNNGGKHLWIGNAGSTPKDGPPFPRFENGGFELAPGARKTISAPDNWSGRFWARTECDWNGSKHCLTGDCGPQIQCDGRTGEQPATLIELSLKTGQNKDLDFYNLSLVDGFNVAASIQPVGGTSTGQNSCKTRTCLKDLVSSCPNELKKMANNKLVACWSACSKFNTDEYCCKGAFNDPNKCKGHQLQSYYKQNCPDAYSYAYEDTNSLFTCIKAKKYVVEFKAF